MNSPILFSVSLLIQKARGQERKPIQEKAQRAVSAAARGDGAAETKTTRRVDEYVPENVLVGGGGGDDVDEGVKAAKRSPPPSNPSYPPHSYPSHSHLVPLSTSNLPRLKTCPYLSPIRLQNSCVASTKPAAPTSFLHPSLSLRLLHLSVSSTDSSSWVDLQCGVYRKQSLLLVQVHPSERTSGVSRNRKSLSSL